MSEQLKTTKELREFWEKRAVGFYTASGFYFSGLSAADTKSLLDDIATLQRQLAEALAQLQGCTMAALNYDKAVEHGNAVGFGDDFKHVLTLRQNFDGFIREAALLRAREQRKEHNREMGNS